MVLIRGLPMEVHQTGELLSNHILREQDFFEAEILDYLRDNHPEHTTIIDIGANIGNHTLYFARYLQYQQIIAFEPLQENWELLVKNCRQYRKILYMRNALTDSAKRLTIRPNRGNMGASEVVEVAQEGDVTVDGYPLDYFLPVILDCTLIKIDVEWHEPQVIMGAQQVIQTFHPLILIEDARKEYGPLLPDYECIKEWDHHKTYLYKWRGA